jgi:hypothetical protein
MAVRIKRANVLILVLVIFSLLIIYQTCCYIFEVDDSSSVKKVNDDELRFLKLPRHHLNLTLEQELEYFQKLDLDREIESHRRMRIRPTVHIGRSGIKATAKIQRATEFNKSRYSVEVSKDRLDRLFGILREKEDDFSETLDELDVISFRKLAEGGANAGQSLQKFPHELEKYIKVDGGKVRATSEFVNYLTTMSDKHSFENPRNKLVKARIEQVFLKI